MQGLQSLFRFSQMAGIGYGIARTVGQEFLEAHINTGVFASRNVLDRAFCLYGKLAIVAIGPSNDAYPLDVLDRERFNALILAAYQA